MSDDNGYATSHQHVVDPAPTTCTVTLTRQERDDIARLIELGADDAAECYKLPDFTDEEAEELLRLSNAASALTAKLNRTD